MADAKQNRFRDHLFGMAAVDLQLLTPAQVGELFMLQMMSDPEPPLSQVAIKQGYLQPEDVKAVLAHQQKLQRRFGAEASLFGQIAVSLGLITREQVGLCVAKQRSDGFRRKLGEVCVDLGFLEPADVQRILSQQDQVKRQMAAEMPLFGRVAVDMGLLKREQLEICVAQQLGEGSVRRIGELCVENGFLQPDQVKRVLARQRELRGEPPPARDSTPGAPPVAPRVAAAPAQRPPPAPRESRPAFEAMPRPQARHEAAVPDARATQPRLEPAPPAAPRPAALDASPASAPTAPEPAVVRWLRQLVEAEATELHIVSGHVPHLRIDGELRPGLEGVLSAVDVRTLLLEVMPRGAHSHLELGHHAEFVYEVARLARFRVNAFLDAGGPGAVVRRIPMQIPSPEQLGLPPQLGKLCWHRRGLVLIGGGAGSGRTTTLAALIDFINHNRVARVVTIEDPIELVHRGDRCLVSQRQLGTHAASSEKALGALRHEQPDVLAIDELRDARSVEQALEAAGDGTLVLATVAARSAASAIEKLSEPSADGARSPIRAMLADSLLGVVVQTLCQRAGGGRQPAFEILLGTPTVSDLVRETRADELEQVMQLGAGHGMCTLNQHLVELVRAGVVEPAEAVLRSNAPLVLGMLLSEIGVAVPSVPPS